MTTNQTQMYRVFAVNPKGFIAHQSFQRAASAAEAIKTVKTYYAPPLQGRHKWEAEPA